MMQFKLPTDLYSTTTALRSQTLLARTPRSCRHGYDCSCNQYPRPAMDSASYQGLPFTELEQEEEDEEDDEDDEEGFDFAKEFSSKPAQEVIDEHLIDLPIEVIDDIVSEEWPAVAAEVTDNSCDDTTLLALLTPDTDIAPSLPVIEILFEDTLHELFYASSEAFKASRMVPANRGPLLLPNSESLLEEPLSVLFEHLRQDILVARYEANAAHYEMGMIFKGLEDLWLLEHEGAVSSCSLLKLVQLYMTKSGMQGQEMLLEPFQIELNIQETFISHLGRLEGRKASKAQLQQSDDAAAERDDVKLSGHTDDATLELDADVQLTEDVEDDVEKVADLTDYEQLIADAAAAAAAAAVASANESLHDDETFDITKIDVDSLACFDDKAYDEVQEYGAEDERASLRIEIAAHDANSPTSRSPKRSVEELFEMLDDEFVNELGPDREVFKRLKMET